MCEVLRTKKWPVNAYHDLCLVDMCGMFGAEGGCHHE